MLNITITEDEGQYLVNAINTHLKTHGLAVATTAVIIVGKLQAANGAADDPEKPPLGDDTES